MPEEVDVKTVIVCDDVRREDNGKWLLIGVYAKDIGFHKLPDNFSFSVWIELDYLAVGEHDFSFRAVHQPGETELFTVGGRVEVKRAERRETLVMAGLPALIPGEGELEVQARWGSAEWRVIKTMPIVQRGRPANRQQQSAEAAPSA